MRGWRRRSERSSRREPPPPPPFTPGSQWITQPPSRAVAYMAAITADKVMTLPVGWRLIVERESESHTTFTEERIEPPPRPHQRAVLAWGQDPQKWPAWTCICGQLLSGWSLNCGRCGRGRFDGDQPIPGENVVGYGAGDG